MRRRLAKALTLVRALTLVGALTLLRTLAAESHSRLAHARIRP